MPDTALSLVTSDASQQLTGRVTLLERKTALDALAQIAGQARSGEGGSSWSKARRVWASRPCWSSSRTTCPTHAFCRAPATACSRPGRSVRSSTSRSRYTAACARCAGRRVPEQLFDALLTELCEPGPLPVVVIEDVHWADEATLDLLGYLGRRIREIAVLLIVSSARRAGRHPSAAHCSRSSGRPALRAAPPARSPQCPSRAAALGRPRGGPRGVVQGHRRQPVLHPRGAGGGPGRGTGLGP